MKMKQKSVNSNILLLIFFIILLVSLVTNYSAENKSKQIISIHRLHICQLKNGSINAKEDWKTQITLDENDYFACGYLDSKSPVVLDLYIKREKDMKVIYANPVNEKFENGFFYSRIDLNRLNPGKYVMQIKKGRELLSTFEFILVN